MVGSVDTTSITTAVALAIFVLQIVLDLKFSSLTHPVNNQLCLLNYGHAHHKQTGSLHSHFVSKSPWAIAYL
jgi:hypothetical protein